ncbi:MAG: TetR/AcrR family transcriptional regulator [Ardenticatenales bacterium]|nr:TetR/AcrR family transcriptional regulator [Ardenticatenales bacterium]
MPPRDEQEFENRRQHIINGALRVFSRKGFEKATNRDIAEAAGIGSPGLIYHYFKDKRDLFQQVIEGRMESLQLLNHSEALMELPPEEALSRLAMSFLNTMSDPTAVSLFRLILGEALRHPQLAALLNSIGPGRVFAFLERYLARQMELGLMRQMDPGAAARCFMGPLIAYILTGQIFPQRDAETLSRETMANTAVEVFLRGMEPR